jgi:murein L,D-transpeptidase YcbB/YkuD
MDRGVRLCRFGRKFVRAIRVSYLAGTALALVLLFSARGANAQTAEIPIPPIGDNPVLTDADIQPNYGDTKTADTKPEADKLVIDAAPSVEPSGDAQKPAVETAAPAAPASTPAVVDASVPASPDTMIADRLKEVIGTKLDRTSLRKAERSAAEAFYRDRNFAPLWITGGALNANGKAAIDYLAHVDRDGLEPSDYPVPDFAAAGDPEAKADAELKLTAAILTYARHALHGRVAWSRVASDIFYSSSRPGTDEVLKKLAASSDMAATLDGFEPQFAAYQKLKQALADVRAGKLEEKKAEEKPVVHVRIPQGRILRLGMRDERVPLLRKRLDIGGEGDVYDETVQDAVKAFQTESELIADGNVGPNTTRALNGERPAASRHKRGDPVETIIVNLERWRWVPRDLGNPYVVVNIPDYRLTLWNDGEVYWSSKIVVGKPGLRTPLITAEMKYITVNPTWNVPPSIIENEYLPALQQDPMALERIGLKIEQAEDGTIRVWQPPGAGNALGRLRFNFPNKFLVYQHDTPDKYLFKKDLRAYSHGCMRVQDPLTYAEKLLSLTQPQEHYTKARIERMYGDGEINISFPASKYIPVHLTYQTAFVDPDGKLQFREDVYGHDARMIAILKGERKVADIPVERPPNTSSKPVRAAPGMYGGSYSGGGPGDFFDWIFGGAPRTYYPPPPRRYYNNGRVSYR